MAHAADGWGVRDIRQRCQDLRAVLADSPDLCTPKELADYWPGGAENQIQGRGAWVYCLTQLCRLLGRLELLDDTPTEDAEQAALHASQELPVAVTLQDQGTGSPPILSVYPKSYEVISYCDEMDLAARWLLARAHTLIEQDTPASVFAGQDALQRITELHLLMVWIVTTEGPGAPFPLGEVPPPGPVALRDLTPLDIVAILRAYLDVNRTRVALTVSLLRPQADESRRVQWAVLAAGAAKNLNQPIEQLLKHRSFGAWVAQFVLVSRAEIERAEREQAGRKRPEMPAFEEMVP